MYNPQTPGSGVYMCISLIANILGQKKSEINSRKTLVVLIVIIRIEIVKPLYPVMYVDTCQNNWQEPTLNLCTAFI